MTADSTPIQHRHPVRVVSERTGLSPHVLRIWERRYQAVTPARSEGGQRLYSDADIERLSLLHRAAAVGRNVSQLVGLPDEELRGLIADDERARVPPARAGRTAAAAGELETQVGEALAAVMALDGDRLSAMLRHSLLEHGVATTIEGLMAPLLTVIGERWHTGELAPLHEHLATGIIQRLLAHMAYDSAAGPLTRPRILVATPARQRHEIGAMLVAATASTCDWNVLYLGQDLPVRDIARAADLGTARIVALSLVYPADDAELAADLRWLAGALPPQVTLLLGGAAAAAYAPQAPGARVVESLAEFREILRASRPA